MARLIVVMGVSGCGKSVVGRRVANELGCPFVDSDTLHPPENVARMTSGQGLDDESRQPWLQAICQVAEDHFDRGESVVIACSALKAKYRDQLRTVSQPVVFLFLKGTMELIESRLARREGHYMPASLLGSQFADLEDPTNEAGVVTLDIDQTVDEMIQDWKVALNRSTG